MHAVRKGACKGTCRGVLFLEGINKPPRGSHRSLLFCCRVVLGQVRFYPYAQEQEVCLVDVAQLSYLSYDCNFVVRHM